MKEQMKFEKLKTTEKAIYEKPALQVYIMETEGMLAGSPTSVKPDYIEDMDYDDWVNE